MMAISTGKGILAAGMAWRRQQSQRGGEGSPCLGNQTLGQAADEELVILAGQGDRRACAILVERHLNLILAFSRRMLRDRAEAEDVAQETFLRLWTHAARWEARGVKLTAWLHRVAANLCLDRLRRRRGVGLDEAPEVADSAPNALEQLAAAELSGKVQMAIAALPERQRMALVLSHFQGLGNSDIATILETGVEAVESLLARGRRALRAALAAEARELMGGRDDRD